MITQETLSRLAFQEMGRFRRLSKRGYLIPEALSAFKGCWRGVGGLFPLVTCILISDISMSNPLLTLLWAVLCP